MGLTSTRAATQAQAVKSTSVPILFHLRFMAFLNMAWYAWRCAHGLVCMALSAWPCLHTQQQRYLDAALAYKCMCDAAGRRVVWSATERQMGETQCDNAAT